MLNNNAKRKILGQNIAKYRKEKKLSQNQLAELLDISREHLAKVETARRNISMDLLYKLSDVLCVPERYFLDFRIK